MASEDVWKALLYDKVRPPRYFAFLPHPYPVQNGQKVKKYQDYNKWRTKAFPEYERITELMGGNQATGEHAFASRTREEAAPLAAPAEDTPDTCDDDSVDPRPSEQTQAAPATITESPEPAGNAPVCRILILYLSMH